MQTQFHIASFTAVVLSVIFRKTLEIRISAFYYIVTEKIKVRVLLKVHKDKDIKKIWSRGGSKF